MTVIEKLLRHSMPRMACTADWGHDLESDVVDKFKDDLENQLVDAGYTQQVYRRTDFSSAVSYVLDRSTPFRSEPILIDDGGTIFARSRQQMIDALRLIERPDLLKSSPFYDGIRVLKIAIRETNHNEEVSNMVENLLVQYNLFNPVPLVDNRIPETTTVYALKRC